MKRLDGLLSVFLPGPIGADLLLKPATALGFWGSGFGGRPEGEVGILFGLILAYSSWVLLIALPSFK